MKRRNVSEILSDSLNDHCVQQSGSQHISIQSDVRYQLIIDSSIDESLSRFLFVFKLLDKAKTKMFVCSSFPGDVHGTVCLNKVTD